MKQPTENVSITMNLLHILDTYCCENDLNRTQIIYGCQWNDTSTFCADKTRPENL